VVPNGAIIFPAFDLTMIVKRNYFTRELDRHTAGEHQVVVILLPPSRKGVVAADLRAEGEQFTHQQICMFQFR
jgi:hypothetical protein